MQSFKVLRGMIVTHPDASSDCASAAGLPRAAVRTAPREARVDWQLVGFWQQREVIFSF